MFRCPPLIVLFISGVGSAHIASQSIQGRHSPRNPLVGRIGRSLLLKRNLNSLLTSGYNGPVFEPRKDCSVQEGITVGHTWPGMSLRRVCVSLSPWNHGERMASYLHHPSDSVGLWYRVCGTLDPRHPL